MALGCRYAIVARMRHRSVDGLGRGHVFKCLGVPARHATRRCGWPEERQVDVEALDPTRQLSLRKRTSVIVVTDVS